VPGAECSRIGDLCVLAGDTHKFESRYLESLVGRWPEDEALYKARSPINSVDQLDCPVALFQGLEDKVVPPNQVRDNTATAQSSVPPHASRRTSLLLWARRTA
jgi:fermentation-respiration switch protein FrsA (DUF1100 family)